MLAHPWTAGTLLAGRRYRILRTIGQGAMSAVYQARDEFKQRDVAIKVLLPKRRQQAVPTERFLNEGHVIASIRHPNIVHLFDWGETDGKSLYLAMEYLIGKSLGDRLEGATQLSWRESAPILTQICEGMQAAHDAEVIHRDLKPDNIWLVSGADSGIGVKILDFGLAKLMGSRAGPRLTRSGVVVGTPSFLAPEQIRGDADSRSDIYALGLIAYRMLAGRMPFHATNVIEMMQKQLAYPPPGLRAAVPDLAPEVESLVLNALAKKPDERFASMREFSAAIAAI